MPLSETVNILEIGWAVNKKPRLEIDWISKYYRDLGQVGTPEVDDKIIFIFEVRESNI